MSEQIETEAEAVKNTLAELKKDASNASSIITQEIRDRICDLIAEGGTVRQICKQPGMPARATVYLELARNEAFAEQYSRAMAAQTVMWEDELIEIAEDGSNDWIQRETRAGDKEKVVDHEHINRSRLRVDTRKWIMAKRQPKKYGDKLTNIHEGGDKPVQHEVNARDKVAGLLSGIADRQEQAAAPEKDATVE
jgi:hypothetical protein